MARYFIDWNCKLFSDIREFKLTSKDSLFALSYLQQQYNVRAFCFTPTFRAEADSVAAFLLRRDKIVADLLSATSDSNHLFSAPVKIMASSSVLLEKDLHEVLNLHKLTVPFGVDHKRYLPILMPLGDYADWMDLELNRLLYRANFKPLFLSFEIACLFYPQHIIEKLIRIEDAVFQFQYASLANPKMIPFFKMLLAAKATVVFGTSLHFADKIYQYKINDYLDEAKDRFEDFEFAHLLKYSCAMPQKHPKSYRIV